MKFVCLSIFFVFLRQNDIGNVFCRFISMNIELFTISLNTGNLCGARRSEQEYASYLVVGSVGLLFRRR